MAAFLLPEQVHSEWVGDLLSKDMHMMPYATPWTIQEAYPPHPPGTQPRLFTSMELNKRGHSPYSTSSLYTRWPAVAKLSGWPLSYLVMKSLSLGQPGNYSSYAVDLP